MIFFSNYGIPKHKIQSLKLDEALLATQTFVNPSFADIGLSGHDADLKVAASLVKLARENGKVNRAIAIGLNNEHWVVALLKQSETGTRQWYFMDSWRNQTRYKQAIIEKIEVILNKTENQLKQYLVDAYDSVNDTGLHHRYKMFFNQESGLCKTEKIPGFGPNETQSWDALDFFMKNQANTQESLDQIQRSFQFMCDAGWLTSVQEKEMARIKTLYNIAHFMLSNAKENALKQEDIKRILRPICKRLEQALQKKGSRKEAAPKTMRQQTCSIISKHSGKISTTISSALLFYGLFGSDAQTQSKTLFTLINQPS